MEAVLDMGSCSACADVRKMWKSWRLPLVVMLYCTTFLTVIAQEVPPLFTLEPKSAVVRESAKHILRCRATPEGSTIHWLFNGKNITDILPDVDIHNEKLVIKSFRTTSRSRQQETQGHDGIYQCVASNSMGGVTSKEATLWSAYISEFYNGFNDMYINVTEGNVAFIPCSPPSGRPDPVIGFELNGTEINQNSDHFQILPSGNLQIRDARPRDRGRYRCTATNSINGEKHKASNTIHLNVIPPMSNSPPVFRWVPPSEVKVVRGENLTLECVVEGAPVPVVTWSKYGGKLPDDRYTMLLGNLVLYNVGKLDEGTYICSADNGIGTRQVAIAQVDVLEPPTIQHPPANQIVSEGTSATFECQGRGQPAVMLEWFHNGRKVESGKGIISIDETSLTINQVRRNHAGVYQCTAKSSLGSVSAAAMLNVLKPGESPPPEVTESAAKWQQEKMQKNAPQTDGDHPSETPSESDGNFKDPSPDGDTSSYPTMPLEGPSNEDGDDIEIREGDGNRRRDKKRRNKNRNRDQPTGDDRELSRKDGGETRDTAETRNNNEEMIPPSKPRVSKLSDTSVMLEWRHPANDGLSVTFFKVQYKEMVRDKSRRHWRTIDEDIPSHVRQFEVPELKPGSTYRFRIVGVYSNNDNKHGANSRKFRLETPSVQGPTVPLTGPVIVEAKSLSQNSISLKWQYSPDEWSPIEGFHIYYHIYGTQIDSLKKTVIGSHVQETQLTGLQPNTMYSIKMQGFNRAGESGDSNTVVKRTSESDEAWEPNWTDLLPGTNTATQTSTLSAEIDEPALSTESSSKMLYIVLGSVLGAMVLFLLFFMAMCAWKQKQRAQMLAAIEGRNKFQDPSRVIYAQDTVRQKQMNGNGFLLNGLNGVSNHQSNGSVSNGHLPMYTYPRMNVTSNPMQEDGHGSLPHGHTSPTIDYSDYRADNNHSIIQEMLDNPPPPPPMECCEDGRCDSLHDSQRLDFRESPGRYEPNMSTFGRSSKAPPRVRPPLDPCLYDNNSPNYNTTGSQRSHDQNSWQRSHDQNSWRSGNSRIHEPHLTDHIPRSHERLYGRQHQGEPLDGTSEHSRESSSRGSTGKYKHHRRKPSDDRGNSINGTTPQCQGLLSEQSPSSDYKPDHQDGSNSPASTSDELDHPVFSPDHLTGRIPDEVDSDHEHSPLNPNKGHHPIFPPHHLSGHIPPPYDYDYTDTEQEQTDYEQIDESIDSIDHHTPPPAYNRRGYDYHRNISDEEEDGESLPDIPPSPPPLSRLPGIHGYQHTHLQVS